MESVNQACGRRCAEYEKTGLFLAWAKRLVPEIEVVPDLFRCKNLQEILDKFERDLPLLKHKQTCRRIAKAHQRARFVRRTRMGIV